MQALYVAALAVTINRAMIYFQYYVNLMVTLPSPHPPPPPPPPPEELDFRTSYNLVFRDADIILCPFSVYYLRYAVGSFFTMSRIPLADGKRAG
jgi:hypothetical protein